MKIGFFLGKESGRKEGYAERARAIQDMKNDEDQVFEPDLAVVVQYWSTLSWSKVSLQTRLR